MILFFSPSEWKREKGGSESCFRGLSRPGGGGAPFWGCARGSSGNKGLETRHMGGATGARGRLWSRTGWAGRGGAGGGAGSGGACAGRGRWGLPGGQRAGHSLHHPPQPRAKRRPVLGGSGSAEAYPLRGEGTGQEKEGDGKDVVWVTSLEKTTERWPLPCFSQGGWGVLS